MFERSIAKFEAVILGPRIDHHPSIHTKLLPQNGKEPGLSQTSIWRLFRNNGLDVLAYT